MSTTDERTGPSTGSGDTYSERDPFGAAADAAGVTSTRSPGRTGTRSSPSKPNVAMSESWSTWGHNTPPPTAYSGLILELRANR